MKLRNAVLGVGVTALALVGCGTHGSEVAAPRAAVHEGGDFSALLAASIAPDGSSAQRRALELIDTLGDDEVTAVYPAIERACLDGRGQDIAPVIHAYLDRVQSWSPARAERDGERVLARCGVYDWQPRESRLGVLRVGPRRYAAKTETEVILAVIRGAGG
jgi:hypothetical protein